MAAMKLKKLESNLQEVEVFDNPKISLEQYPTSPHIAAVILHHIQSSYDDIENKHIADLGCGCGVLSIGCVMLNCSECLGVDIDDDALQVCRTNIRDYEIDNIDLVQLDISAIDPLDPRWHNKVDTVIMNPPFGTKKNEGMDMHFLKVALCMTTSAVYSLHKSSTRKYILKACSSMGVEAEVQSQVRFDLKNTYKYHKKDSVDIEVDFIRFSFKESKEKFFKKLKF